MPLTILKRNIGLKSAQNSQKRCTEFASYACRIFIFLAQISDNHSSVYLNVCCTRVYSTYPVQADSSQTSTAKMHSNLSKSTCVGCHQLQQVPCGFAHALSLYHCCSVTLILMSLLATMAASLATDLRRVLYPCTLR